MDPFYLISNLVYETELEPIGSSKLLVVMSPKHLFVKSLNSMKHLPGDRMSAYWLNTPEAMKY